MALLNTAGLSRLAAQRRDEIAELSRVTERAVAILDASPEGIRERALCTQLKQECGTTQSVAASAVDYLRSSGKATKNWETGLLTPTYK
jgi:hypothetical protein